VCINSDKGPLTGLNAAYCSREQFEAEVLYQFDSCDHLQNEIRALNGGVSLAELPVHEFGVWHDWQFGAPGTRVQNENPRFSMSTIASMANRPGTVVPTINNLFLAGAHVRTSVEGWGMESAVESGRLAAMSICGNGCTIPYIKFQHHPILRVIHAIDDSLFMLHAPPLGQIILMCALFALVLCVVKSSMWRSR
jgi:hypothetical protein